MPTISVIVPIYNTEKYLPRCIDSILAQTFMDFELILVDDGSTDSSGAICDKYAASDERIIVCHKKNGGVSTARNAGIQLATGEYLAFCDSDDYLKEYWIKSLFEAIRIAGSDLVSADYTVCDSEAHEIRTCNHKNKSVFSIQTEKQKIDFIIKHILSWDLGWEVCTKLFLRSIIIQNNIQFCETCENFAEDLGFVMEYLLYCSTVSTIVNAGYCYIQHPQSMMRKTQNDVKLNAMNEVSSHFGKRYLALFHGKENKQRFAVMHYLIMNNQYKRIVMTDNYQYLPEEIRKIKNQRWFKRQTVAAFGAYKAFCYYFGKPLAQKIMLLTTLCLHRSWLVHCYLSAIFYRFIYSRG